MSRWFLLLFFVSATVINAWFVASTVKQSRSHLWSEKNGAESSSSPRRRPIRSPLRRQQPIETDASSSTFSDTTPTTPTLTAHEQALQDPALLSSTNFTSMIQSPALLRSIREMGMERLTRVQAETFLPILEGKSICARSKTGSGKTLAMLLPVLERLSKPKLTSLNYDDHCVLIIVPTRELALQFAEQAKELLVHGPSNINVVCLHGGGKSMAVDRRTLQAKYKEAGSGALILVATPGRLVDHISLETSKSRSNRNTLVKSILGSAKTLILDEADRLLLEGFQKEIRLISSQLPRPEKRQTLLFSATVPSKMTPLLEIILSKDFVQVDCTEGRGENDRLIRSFLRLPSMELYSSCLISILQQEMQKDPACYKVLVFFPTARLVRFYANLFNDALKVPVLEIHSRMSQSGRNKARTAFTQAKRGIMFTSDVSARGE
jgi:ATP-dependent RNA helicase MSS116